MVKLECKGVTNKRIDSSKGSDGTLARPEPTFIIQPTFTFSHTKAAKHCTARDFWTRSAHFNRGKFVYHVNVWYRHLAKGFVMGALADRPSSWLCDKSKTDKIGRPFCADLACYPTTQAPAGFREFIGRESVTHTFILQALHPT